ncbi:MAG TPA: shikimate dehydrogenase [Propionibacteriaceae bacterium]|nr:shikimate dehydrogenase [Propionibacteriaceae bacterium]
MLTTRRCAVLGSPIEHSLSPAIHTAAYAHLGLDWTYGRYEVVAEDLPDFVEELDDSWRGLSCTMPLKHAVVALGHPDEIVSLLGVGNTVVFDGHPSDPSTTRIRNTDVLGLEAALRHAGADGSESALVVGNGATARSALAAVARLGVTRLSVLARDCRKTEALADLGERLGVAVDHVSLGSEVPSCDIALSTIPAEAQLHVADAVASAAPVVFDAVYDPWPTPLARAVTETGSGVLLSGLDLLAWQALYQVELFTDRTLPVSVLLDAAHAALARRA